MLSPQMAYWDIYNGLSLFFYLTLRWIPDTGNLKPVAEMETTDTRGCYFIGIKHDPLAATFLGNF